MLCDVKVVIHDYPKRSHTKRDMITVEADTDDEALALAAEEGKLKWPGGKIKPYDVVNKREKRPVLKAKRP